MTRFCLVGLGNPGSSYASNRHNVGFVALEDFHQNQGCEDWRRWKDIALISRWQDNAPHDARLLKPLTYMNRSGQAVGMACRYWQISPPNIIVFHDELDLKLGDVRLKFGGGAAGHNGVTDCVNALGTKDFWRLRIGIGRPECQPVADYVLSSFNESERRTVKEITAFVAKTLAGLVTSIAKDNEGAKTWFQSERAIFLRRNDTKK